MLKITISGKLNPGRVHKILQEEVDKMLERLRGRYESLENAFANNLVKVEAKVIVVKNPNATVIFETDSLDDVRECLKESIEFYEEVSLTTQEVEDVQEPNEDMVVLEEPIAQEITAEDRERERILFMSLCELNLSVRVRKCMNRLRIETIGDLVKKTAEELLEVKTFGPTGLQEVQEKLGQYGLKLEGD